MNMTSSSVAQSWHFFQCEKTRNGLRPATLLKTILWHRCFPKPATLLKKRLWYRCFPVNFAKFLRTCARVSFLIKLQAWGLQLYQKRDSGAGVFLWILSNFQQHFFYRTPPVTASKMSHQRLLLTKLNRNST